MGKKEVKKLKPTKKGITNNPNGAPTKYRPEYCQRMLNYFDVEILTKSGYKTELNMNFPTFQGFAAKELRVSHQTLLNWCNDYPEFSETYAICKSLQERLLVIGGITKTYDSGFSKFILNSVSDTFKEKVVVEADDETKNLIKLAYALPAKTTQE